MLNPSAAPERYQCSMVSATCSGVPANVLCPRPPPSRPISSRTVSRSRLPSSTISVYRDLEPSISSSSGGRVDRRRDVGVPAGEVAVLALAGLLLEVLAVALLVPPRVDREDLRVPVRRGVVVRMGVGQLAELTAERDLGRVVQLLVAEENHLVLVQGVLQVLDRVFVERLGNVDIRDIRTDVTCDRTHGDGLFLDSGHRQFLRIVVGCMCRSILCQRCLTVNFAT